MLPQLILKVVNVVDQLAFFSALFYVRLNIVHFVHAPTQVLHLLFERIDVECSQLTGYLEIVKRLLRFLYLGLQIGPDANRGAGQ